jgi:hypothetical protein
MASIPTHINGWVTVEFIVTSQGQVWETVFNYRGPNRYITEGELQSFVNTWAGIMNPLALACMGVGVQLQEVRAKTHHKDFLNVEASWLPTVLTTGTSSADMEPGNVSLAVKLLTGAIGRSRRGRQYMPGLTEAFVSGNNALAVYVGAVGSLFARHLTGFTALSNLYLPAIASRKLGLLFDVVEFALDYYIDSQRRRLTGRGQ